MKFLINDWTGIYMERGEKLVDAEAFEKIANDYHKYETVEITGMRDGIPEVWIHYPGN